MKRLIWIPALWLCACEVSVDTSTYPVVNANEPEIEAEATRATATIGAYMIVRGRNYEPAALGAYAASLPPIYAKYGGRYVAFETDIDVAEGNSDDQAVIISAWPDKAAARAFWDSPEYAEAIKLRDGIGEFDVVIVGALPERE